jgi:hypothetical protein
MKASCLNRVESWFSILSARSLDRAHPRAFLKLVARVKTFVVIEKETARPLIRKEERSPKRTQAELR